MPSDEPSLLTEKQLETMYKNAILSYRGRDYIKARELLEIILRQDPLYQMDGRPASDLLADVEIQLAEKNSTKRKNRFFIGLSIFLGVLLVILIPWLVISVLRINRLQAAGAGMNATMSAQTSLLRSAYVTVTAASAQAESARATMTVMRQNPGSAQATIQAYEKQASAFSLSGEPIFGPVSGELVHDQSDYVISTGAEVSLKNLIVEATFINPYDSNENAWDYGFFFRDTGGDHQYRLSVNSDSTWSFDFVDDPTWNNLDNGSLTGLDTSAEGKNVVRLVVINDRALFYLNGRYISTLDTSAKQTAGDVYIVTAAYSGNEILGRSTQFTDFSIWPLP